MKISRLLGITVLLLNREKATARELARYFEVSERTILRDIEALSEAGIPIVASQGSGGGIGLMEGYTLDRQFLSFGELSSVVTALQGIAGLFAAPGYREAVDKIEALVPRSRKGELSEFRDMLDLDFTPWTWGRRNSTFPAVLLKAIRSRRTVKFRYLNSAGEILDRVVEPHRLSFRGSSWYLIGYCRLRGDFRVFRLSRIRDLSPGAEIFSRRKLPGEMLDSFWNPAPRMIRMTLRFAERVRFLVEDTFAEESIERGADGSLIVKADYPEDDWLYGFLLGFGDRLEVVAPEPLRRKIAETAEKIVSLYRT